MYHGEPFYNLLETMSLRAPPEELFAEITSASVALSGVQNLYLYMMQ